MDGGRDKGYKMPKKKRKKNMMKSQGGRQVEAPLREGREQ